MRICRWPHPFGVRPQISPTNGSRSGPRHTLRMRQVMVVRGSGQSRYPQEVVEPVSPPCEQSRRSALRSRRVTWTPAGPGAFSRYATFAFEIGDLFGELLLARRFGSRLGFRALRSALGLRPERLRASRPVLAAPSFQRRDARDRVLRHDLRLGHAVLDVVARRGDLRLPHVYRIVRNAFIPVLIFRMNHIHRWIMKTRSLGRRYPLLSLSRLCMADTPRKSVLRGYENSCHDNLTCHI